MEEGVWVDVGGHKLFLRIWGAGGPPVVFECGLEESSETLAAVARAVAGFTTVCLYDRAGLGRSDPAWPPRSSHNVADELHALLGYAEVSSPRVFVGHAIAALHLRVYAQRYPAAMAGLVLIEPTHPEQWQRTLALLPPRTSSDHPELAEFRKELRTQWFDTVATVEQLDLVACAEQAQAAGELGDLPLMVISAGLDSWPTGTPPAIAARLSQERRAMQQQTAALSRSSRQIHATRSSHAVQEHEPALIVQAVRELVALLRHTA